MVFGSATWRPIGVEGQHRQQARRLEHRRSDSGSRSRLRRRIGRTGTLPVEPKLQRLVDGHSQGARSSQRTYLGDQLGVES